jgi:flagellar biosynthetic protein FliO
MIKKCGKEVLYWTLLLATAMVFSQTVSFAQSTSPQAGRKNSSATQPAQPAQTTTSEIPSASPQVTPESPVAPANDHLPFMKADETAVEAPSTGGLLIRTLGALLLIVGLIIGGAWALKRFAGNRFNTKSDEGPALTVLSTVSLGDRRSLSVVRFGDRTLLLGSTQQSITLLSTESPTEIAPVLTRSVAELLKDNSFDHQLDVAEHLLADQANTGVWRDEAPEA